MEKTDTAKKPNGIGRLLQIAGPKKFQLFLAGVLALVHAGLALVPYILVFQVMAEMLEPAPDYAALRETLILAGVAGLLSYAVLYASGMLSHLAAFDILYQLRRYAAEKIGKLSLGELEKYNSGALKKILIDDIERIEHFLAHQIPDFFKGLTLPLLTVVYLFYVDWRLALVSLLPLLFMVIWFPYVMNRADTRSMLKFYHQALEDMNSGIVEYIRAMPVMKIFRQTADRFHKYSGTVHGYDEMAISWTAKGAPSFAIFMSFMSNALLPILIFGTWLYLQNGLKLATFFLFLILGTGYIKPVFSLSNMAVQISMINRGVQRMDDILNRPLQPVPPFVGEQNGHGVVFDGVEFAYVPGTPVLEEVGFSVSEGSLTALVGPSGAGKSTVAQLIARFWDVSQGEIRIGGRPLMTFSTEELAEKVSYVFQDNFMFHLSLYDNIRMGMDRSREQIEAASRAAQCHAFIEQLPEGYDTIFGAEGVHLSGGEQQRIQIARAILKDAPILILDEATSYSDPENEFLIQQAIGHLIQEKTVILIAHRLNTVVNADQIIVFDTGRIVGRGKHAEILESCPLYAQMWQAHRRTQSFSIR
ncbi:MAG: ABC transporter ATP-binding protein [Bacteroidota bacterium]